MSSSQQYQNFLPKNLGLFINNQFVASSTGKSFPVVTPSTEQEICKVAEANAEDVNKAVAAAKAAGEGEWKTMGPKGRRNLILKFADIWEKRVEALAQLESLNNGSPIGLQKSIIAELANDLRYYAGWADKLDGRVPAVESTMHIYTRREPLGVCGIILPWNLPLWALVTKLGPCLASGNTCVIKPAEQTPLSALMVAELIVEAGFPAGVVNIINGFGPTAGAPITRHMDVAKVAFTGSTEVGKIIMQDAAKSNLKRVQLELGGKSPLIIFEDANIDEAVQLSCIAMFSNNGQLCTAASRAFVHEKIYDKFVEKAQQHINTMKVGNPLEQSNNIGPVVDKEQYQKVLGYIDYARVNGASVAQGGVLTNTSKGGYFILPTLISGVDNTHKCAAEEIFGPVQVIIKFKSIEEVLKLANQTEYGLAAGVITKDIGNVFAVANNVKAGTVWVNTYHVVVPNAEFGGFKQSGFGREGGEDGIKEWTATKTVIVNIPSRI